MAARDRRGLQLRARTIALTEAQGASDREAGSWAEMFRGRYAAYTFILNLGMTLFAINMFVVTTIMPTVVRDLGGLSYYAWSFSLFAVGAIVGSASAGPLRDAFGARRAYAGAGLVLAVGLTGAALAHDMPTLVFWRLVQGVGGGAVASQAYGLVAVAFPARLRGRALGLISSTWGVATLGGPGFGGVFAEFNLWRGAFWSLVPLTILFVLLAWRYVADTEAHGRLSRIPYGRLLMLGASVLLFSLTSLTEDNVLRAALIVASLALAALAFIRDTRAERNMFPRRAMVVFTELGAAYWILFLVSIVITFITTFTPFYLQVLHGVTPFAAGYLTAIQSLTWTVTAVVIATLHQRWEIHCIVTGLALVLASSVAFALWVVPGPVAAISVALFVSGIAIGLLNNPSIQRAIAAASGADKHIAGTSVQTIRTIGVSFGAAISGLAAAAAGLTDSSGPAEVAVAMQAVYTVNVGFALLAVALVVPLIAGHRRSERRLAGTAAD